MQTETPEAAETIWGILHDSYFPVRPTIRAEQTRLQYRFAVNDFAKMLGRTPVKSDLTDDNLNALLIYLLDKRGVAEITANERVGRLKTLWTWLAKRGKLSYFPTLSRIPQPERVPRSWNVEELRRLFLSFAQEKGEIGGVPASKWWLSSHAFLWNTGERKGATFLFEFEMLDWRAGVAILPASIRKGRRKSAVYLLWPEVLDMLQDIRLPRRSKVWPFPYHHGTYYNRYERILKRAGLPCGRHHKTQAIRVSHATWLHAMGQDATAALGHSSPETTRASYLDLRIIKPAEKPLFKPWLPDAG